MNVTHVSLIETEAARSAERPALTPELLAATGARYSRNNEGLSAILAKINPGNLDKSVDTIFRMIDYGHQSIADMAPVAMFIDRISIWLAYYIWSICPTAGGQESSTRYIRLGLEGVIPPEQLGIPESERAEWQQTIQQAFSAYEQSLTTWENLALKHPQVIRIPSDLMQDSTEKAARQRNRILRNYAFDRARYFIPSAAATNVMLVMSARGWVQLCQYLLSHPLPEPRDLGRLIKAELSLVTPRLVKHAEPKDSTIAGILEELQVAKAIASIAEGKTHSSSDEQVEKGGAFLELLSPKDVKESDIAGALAQHDNRYAWLGSALRRTAVRFGWKAVSFAEIRDLNRHRTGTKYCPFVPRGFYAALDQTIGSCGLKDSNQLESLVNWGVTVSELSKGMLAQGKWHYVYSTLLGTEFEFEHTTTADKFVYEAELRTGTGAHYRYARHLRDVLALWYEKFPQTKGMILEGSAEPE